MLGQPADRAHEFAGGTRRMRGHARPGGEPPAARPARTARPRESRKKATVNGELTFASWIIFSLRDRKARLFLWSSTLTVLDGAIGGNLLLLLLLLVCLLYKNLVVV